MAEQLTFDLPAKPAMGRDAFLVTPSNAMAVAALEAWADWPDRAALLLGPKGAGKTHLAHVWASETGAAILAATADYDVASLAGGGFAVVEDIHLIVGNAEAEQRLFHLMNMVRAEAGLVLLTGTCRPGAWSFGLADLASRIRALPLAQLDEPDDTLLSAMLVKQFDDRQIEVGPELVAYLVARMQRSADAVRAVVDALDQAALRQHRSLNRRLAAEVLDKLTPDGA